MPDDDLRWSRCNNNRNKGHNDCNVLESYLPPKSMEKLSCTKQVPGAKKVGDHCCIVWSLILQPEWSFKTQNQNLEGNWKQQDHLVVCCGGDGGSREL